MNWLPSVKPRRSSSYKPTSKAQPIKPPPKTNAVNSTPTRGPNQLSPLCSKPIIHKHLIREEELKAKKVRRKAEEEQKEAEVAVGHG